MYKALLLALITIIYPYSSVGDVAAPPRGGSGTVIAVSKDKALILSCAHVIRNSRTASITLNNQKYKGNVIKVDSRNDLAAFIVPRPTGIYPVPIRAPHPNNSPYVSCGFPSYSRGHLHYQKGNYVDVIDNRLYLTSRPTPGMSGGATFDKNGYLVGVVVEYTRTGGRISSGEPFLRFINSLETTQAYTTEGEWEYTNDDWLLDTPQKAEMYFRSGGRFLQRRDYYGPNNIDPNCPDGNCRPIIRNPRTSPYNEQEVPRFDLPTQHPPIENDPIENDPNNNPPPAPEDDKLDELLDRLTELENKIKELEKCKCTCDKSKVCNCDPNNINVENIDIDKLSNDQIKQLAKRLPPFWISVKNGDYQSDASKVHLGQQIDLTLTPTKDE